MAQPLPYRSYPPATTSVLHPPAPSRNMRPETVGEMGTVMSLKPGRYPTKAMEVPCQRKHHHFVQSWSHAFLEF